MHARPEDRGSAPGPDPVETRPDPPARRRSKTAKTPAKKTPPTKTSPTKPQPAKKSRRSTGGTLPEDQLHIVPVRNMVLFPGVVLPLMVGRARSVETLQRALAARRPVGLLLQRDESVEMPGPEGLYSVGSVADLVQYLPGDQTQNHAVCRGLQRFRVLEYVQTEPVLIARIDRVDEPDYDESNTELKARVLALKQQAREVLQLVSGAPEDLENAVQTMRSPGMLADLVATFIDVPVAEKQEVLEAFELDRRLELVSAKLSHAAEVLRLSHKIRAEAHGTLEKAQRDFLLREQQRAIARELGESDERAAEVEELRAQLVAAELPADVLSEVEKEVRRLERIPEGSMELSMVRGYLEFVAELPWSKTTEETLDLVRARKILDEDHYGLEEVKRRILEFLAVRKLRPDGKTQSLCLVGPPGVGKTSLGQSIARAMGRRFVRQSLGGVHDEAEIRGHRRTYVGALPGAVLTGLRKVKTRNPVFMLDEMDKLGRGMHGDPAAALLEVLDPEQNSTFRDSYLNLPFDLSRVLFIGTANVLDHIPGALRDRFEVIHLAGYTREEKLEIAKRYLLARQRHAAGLEPHQFDVEEAALVELIRGYTREAGVRDLERKIAALARHVATKVAAGERRSMKVRRRDLGDILGRARYGGELAARTSVPGVATGLGWTPVGGEILFIEAATMPGRGRLILTGHLGDVMRESARAAMSLVRAHAVDWQLPDAVFDRKDIHLHIPAGAIPKDGPSAGVGMYTALVSLLTGRQVRSDVAMTGEISLRGLVLPVGGIKEKVLAALAAGIKTVLLPARNRPDADEIPAAALEKIELIFVDDVAAVLEHALVAPNKSKSPDPPKPRKAARKAKKAPGRKPTSKKQGRRKR